MPEPRGREKSVPELVSELRELVTTYVRQEVLDPVKGVGRFVAFGVAGAVLIGTGVVILAVGGLRLLQTETDTSLAGNLTWVPYALVFTALLVGGGLSLAAIGRRQGPSGPSERGNQGPSGPSERGHQGPSGPAERATQGPR